MLFLSQIQYFAIAGLILIFSAVMWARIRELAEYFEERKRRREFKKFEDVLSGANSDPEAARKYFSGEVKLPEDIYIIIPELLESEERKNRFEKPIHAALVQADLGKVVRGFDAEGACGFDIFINDFVAGVDLVRRQLVELEAPHGTLIEYSGGDLAIYDLD